MGRVSEREIERMKAEISLEALVRRSGVELRKVGNDLRGRCPFHDDSEPSLVITPAKNLWHCLGECQTGGSVIDWVMRAQGVSYRHALELLKADIPSLAALSPGAAAPPKAPKRSTVTKLPPPVSADDSEEKLLTRLEPPADSQTNADKIFSDYFVRGEGGWISYARADSCLI